MTRGHIHVRRDESANGGIIVPRLQVIPPGFRVVVVPAITERVVLTKRGCQGAGDSEGLAPRVVRVAYHNRARVVHKADDVVLPVAHVVVFRAVVVHGDEIAARVIGVELLDLVCAAARYLRHKEAAVIAVVCHGAADGLAGAHALLVVGIARVGAVAGERGETLTLPGQRVAAIEQGIADRVVGDRLSVVAFKLIAPCGVVGVRDRIRRCAERARGEVVLVAFEDVAGESIYTYYISEF